MEIINVVKRKKKMGIIFSDDEIEVSVNTYARHFLHKGMNLSSGEIEQLLNETRFDEECEIGTRFARNKPKKTVENYLFEKDIKYAKEVLEYLEKYGYINDEHYAYFYVLNNKKNKSQKYIIDELKHCEIDEEIIQKSMENYSLEEENDLLEKLVIKELNSYHNGSLTNFIQKTIIHMINKGFSYENTKKKVEENAKILDNIDEGNSLKKEYLILKNKYRKKLSGKNLDYKIKSVLVSKGYGMEKIEEVRGELNESKEDEC